MAKRKPRGVKLRVRRCKSKTTSSKVANKLYNKAVKRGKIHPGVNFMYRKVPDRGKEDNNVDRLETSRNQSDCDEPEITDMFENEDLENVKQLYNSSFSRNVLNRESKKRKSGDESDESGEDYERVRRTNFGTNKKIRYLLPLKGKDGWIPRVAVEDDEITDNKTEDQVSNNTGERDTVMVEDRKIRSKSYIELYAQRKEKIAMRKKNIAILSCKILENPEENTRSLKELVNMLREKEHPEIRLTVKKLVSLSLLEVFCDIIPGYRIRLPTDRENQQKLKKETRKLRDYEVTLLRHYKRYLTCLESMHQGIEVTSEDQVELKTKIAFSLTHTAVKCFSRLLVTHPHFNYRSNIINLIIPLMSHKNKIISELCCNAIMQLYKEDKLGEASLEAVKETSKLIKRNNYNVAVDVIRTFLFLNIYKVDAKNVEHQKKDMKKIRAQLNMMSRKEKKRRKKMEKLEQELLETEAEESKSRKEKLSLEILKHIFTTYFHIIKKSVKHDLLTPVLEGLAKYAHFINVEFFDDVISAIHKLIDSENLSICNTLHSLQTVFTILSGEGESLNIDPQRFYVVMYKLLLRVNISTPSADIKTLLECLDIMFIKRKKKLTLQRILAFIKRLCTVALHLSHKEALRILAFVRTMIMNHKQSDILFDAENNFGSGTFLPELDDPEHCNAHASVLWELHELHKHYHPNVSKYADYLLKGCKT